MCPFTINKWRYFKIGEKAGEHAPNCVSVCQDAARPSLTGGEWDCNSYKKQSLCKYKCTNTQFVTPIYKCPKNGSKKGTWINTNRIPSDESCKPPPPTCTRAGIVAEMDKYLTKTFNPDQIDTIGNYDEDDFHVSERTGCKLFANWKCGNGQDWNFNVCCRENKRGKELWKVKSSNVQCPATTAPTTTEKTTFGTPTQKTTISTAAPATDPETCPLGADFELAVKGEITHYQAEPRQGNCDLNWSKLQLSGSKGWTHFAALPKINGNFNDRYENSANCGRCVRVKCSCDQSESSNTDACKNGATDTVLMVVDSCATCPSYGDIDTSTAGWNSITGNEGVSSYDGTWEWVECDSDFVTGNTKLRVKHGSGTHWYAFQPVGHRFKITRIQIITNNGRNDLALPGAIDGFWFIGEVGPNPQMVLVQNEEVTLTVWNSEGQTANVKITPADLQGENELVLDGEL